MGEEVSVHVLNQDTSKVLARIKSGEHISVTESGEVIARIVPAAAGPLNALISSGRVQPATSHGPAPRPTIAMQQGIEAGALLECLRDEERY